MVIFERAKCTECGTDVSFTDNGGRCESDLGWLCNDCIKKLQEQGLRLFFEDENVTD